MGKTVRTVIPYDHFPFFFYLDLQLHDETLDLAFFRFMVMSFPYSVFDNTTKSTVLAIAPLP